MFSKKTKSNHDWTVEWIKKFLTFESQLPKLREKARHLKESESLLNEVDKLHYLDLKLRYNIRLHEIGLTKFILEEPDRPVDEKAEYKDHHELEEAIEHYEEQLKKLSKKIKKSSGQN